MIGDSKWEMGEPQSGPQPGDDADFTWHVHPEMVGDKLGRTWGTSIRCTACVADRPDHGGGKTIHWQVNRLRRSNEAGVTQNELRQEIYANARAEGRDIQRAR